MSDFSCDIIIDTVCECTTTFPLCHGLCLLWITKVRISPHLWKLVPVLTFWNQPIVVALVLGLSIYCFRWASGLFNVPIAFDFSLETYKHQVSPRKDYLVHLPFFDFPAFNWCCLWVPRQLSYVLMHTAAYRLTASQTVQTKSQQKERKKETMAF